MLIIKMDWDHSEGKLHKTEDFMIKFSPVLWSCTHCPSGADLALSLWCRGPG